MHRYKAGGLVRGFPSSDEITRRLEELAGKIGGGYACLTLPMVFGRALGSIEEAEREMMRAHVYLCRYMHLSLDEVREMPMEDVSEYMELLSECIKAESPTPAGPGRQ